MMRARRPPPRIAPRAGGFTLLEVLLAVVLLALLIAGAYGGISASVRAMHAGEKAIERIDRVRTASEFLRRQISRTLPLAFAQTETERDVFQGGSDFMRFVAPMPGYLSHGGPYVQTLQLVPAEGGLQLVFTSSMLNGFDLAKSQDAGETPPVVLVDHIRAGKFEYRGLDEQGQLSNWTSNWDEPSATPLMVQIALDLDSGGQVNWPTLAVPLMLDAGAARVQRLGNGMILPRGKQ
ncbi:MAG TPA: prepilin-type N-terminal cleavage/methylation domain-containing protein [Rudaea sp.]